MGLFSKLGQSTDLMNGMAERLGVDLGAAIVRYPEIEAQRYRNMAIRCSSCTDQDACAELQRSSDHLDAAPSYCQNKAVLEARARGELDR